MVEESREFQPYQKEFDSFSADGNEQLALLNRRTSTDQLIPSITKVEAKGPGSSAADVSGDLSQSSVFLKARGNNRKYINTTTATDATSA